MDTHEGYVPSVSCVMCHVSHVMCHMSHVMCHVSRSEHSLHGCPPSRLGLTKCILVSYFFCIICRDLEICFEIFDIFFLQNTSYSYGRGHPAADFFKKSYPAAVAGRRCSGRSSLIIIATVIRSTLVYTSPVYF